MKKGCIYAFVDDKGVPYYIGMTINFKRRMREHLLKIKEGERLPKYYKARKLIGLGSQFNMRKILDDIDENLLKDKEIKTIREFKGKGIKLYNLTDGGDGGDTFSKNPNKEKIREMARLRPSNRKGIKLTKEIKEKIRESKTGKSQGPLSIETKEKISKATKGRVFTKEHKERLRTARRRRVTTEETKKKMSKSMKGKINIKTYNVISPSGKVYLTNNGLTKFCEEHGLCASNLHKVLKGERENHKGWKIRSLK